MSVNTANTPDGRGVLLFNGEMILLYIKESNLSFEPQNGSGEHRGKKQGSLYLTSHRIIFVNTTGGASLRSLSMPFHSVRDVKLEQPIFGANYLHGKVVADPGGNWNGEAEWKNHIQQGRLHRVRASAAEGE